VRSIKHVSHRYTQLVNCTVVYRHCTMKPCRRRRRPYSIDLRPLLRCIVSAMRIDTAQSLFCSSNDHQRRLMLGDPPPLRTQQSTTNVGYRPAVEPYVASCLAIHAATRDSRRCSRPARFVSPTGNCSQLSDPCTRPGRTVLISNLMSLKACRAGRV